MHRHSLRILYLIFTLISGVVIANAAPSNSSPHPPLGINLSGLTDWNTEHPFVDVFRLSREWISQRQGQPWGKGPTLDLDEHGWVRRLEPGCWADTPILTHGHAPSGQYTVLYDGEGDLELKHNAALVSQSPGRMVIEINGEKGGVVVSLKKTNPANPLRNLKILIPGYEKSTSIFHPRFLECWRGFKVFRFMDWQEINNSKQQEWAGRPRLSDATWTRHGAPVELMLDLCNLTSTDPWFCLPHLAGDDYVRQFALLVKQQLDPRRKVYIEYSNEVWNGMFGQHHHVAAKAKELGLGAPNRPWEGAALYHARRSLEIFRIWEQTFASTNRLVRVISWQAAGGDYWTDKMILAQGDTARHCDALAIAPYVSFLIGPNSEPPSDEVTQWSAERILDHAQTNDLPESIKWMRTHKRVADKYNLQLLCYEAGQHLVGVGGGENNEKLTQQLIAANRHPRMGDLYRQYLDGWRDAGGGLCCFFSSVATPSKWGSWGLLEYADQPTAEAPKFKALKDWMASTLISE